MSTPTISSTPKIIIPESQFETWSHQGAIDASKKTYGSIKHALDLSAALSGRDYDVFLQGSYANDTNIRSDSDVDVVVMLKGAFNRDLSRLTQPEQTLYRAAFSDASYGFTEFRADVLKALTAHYGALLVVQGKNSIKVKPSSGRLGADAVVCLHYRQYHRFYSLEDQLYVEGMAFTRQDGVFIVNYPKLHSANCVSKNKTTGGWFKPTVRVFKNMRTRLVSANVIGADIAPSYFVEGLLHNVPSATFGANYTSTVVGSIAWLIDADPATLMCANGQTALIGSGPDQWKVENYQAFLAAVAGLLLGR
jgi:hypothetical protein